MTPTRRTRLLVGVLLPGLLLAGHALGPARVQAEPERVACKHWAVLLPEDGAQHRVYDGIRKGLELAQLERLCLKDLPDADASYEAFVAEQRALGAEHPLIFAVGERALASLLAAGFTGPGVVVSSAPTVKGQPLVAPLALPKGVVRVRGDLAAEAVGQTLKEALGVARPRVAFAWADAPPGAEPGGDHDAAARAFTAAAGMDLVGMEDPPPRAPQALLHVRLGAGETLLAFDVARTSAVALRAPLVSDDPARFGGGAALVIAPDSERLGRQAAEAGRRLWRGEPVETPPLGVRECRVGVDVEACEAQGFVPPLAFLALVHDLRMRSGPAGSR